MTNLRKSFILLSAAITMGNLQQAQAGARKKTSPSEPKQSVAVARQANAQERGSKPAGASRHGAATDTSANTI